MPAVYVKDGDLEGAIRQFKQISASKGKDARRHESFVSPAEVRHNDEFLIRSKHQQNERRRRQQQGKSNDRKRG